MADDELDIETEEVSSDEVEDMPPEPPKARSVLMDILDRAKDDTEAETAKLMSSLREREEEEKQRTLDEEKKKAEESRLKVEAERQKREAALKEYELRKAREAEEERMQAELQKEAEHPPQEEKSRAPLYAAVAVVLIAAVGAGVWLLMPKEPPVTFRLGAPMATARPGAFQAEAVPFGPATVVLGGQVIPPNKLVMVMKPRKYEAPAPKPKRVRKPSKKTGPATPRIRIQTGILGGKKVIK